MRTELLLLGALGTASLILGGPPLSLRSHDWFRFTALGHMYWFALGLGLAVVSVLDWRSGLPRLMRAAASKPGFCWAAAAVIYLLTVLIYYPAPFIIAPFRDGFEYTTLNVVQGVAAVLLFVPAVFGNPNRGLPARLLGHPFLMWVGLISYGLLLWNTTFAVLLGDPGAGEGYWPVLIGGTLISVPAAALSYYLVERPLMKLKYRSLRELLRNRSRRGEPVPDAGGSG